ncbi:MAG TPA: lipocalin family protein [Flavobacteriaceae bacterium]|nr:lipocalin family protein [Flavobacteriaceae bacterium]
MKNPKFLFVLLLSAVMFSCSSDDDSTQDGAVTIEGDWDLTSIEMDGSYEYTMEGVPFPILFEYNGYGKDIDSQTTFTTNPNTVSSVGNLTIVMTIEMLGDGITEEFPVDFSEYVSSGTWEIDGDVLTIVDADGNAASYQIEQLTSTTLVLQMTETFYSQGFPMEIEALVSFSKL